MEPNTLFTPIRLGQITLPNRIFVSPMCQYSSEDGFANDWHLVHLGSRATGGAGLVMTEASAVTPEGRITPGDLGIWKDAHIAKLRQIVEFVHSQGAYAGIQLAHAGRKASMHVPWEPPDTLLSAEQGGWPENILAPSAIQFAPSYGTPRELDVNGIAAVRAAFVAAAGRAEQAGFDVVELHAAHGYLFHEFLSPLSNHRDDNYGGVLENRMRLLLETTQAVRNAWRGTLFVRISATDWTPGGWSIEESTELARRLKQIGVDLLDVSSGGNVAAAKIPAGPGYQVPFSEHIRRESGITTGAVGMITSAAQADSIIRTGQADAVLLAREMLRDPYWPLHAADELGATVPWPKQYLRAAHRATTQREPISRR